MFVAPLLGENGDKERSKEESKEESNEDDEEDGARQRVRGNLTGNAIENGTSSERLPLANSFHKNATTQGNITS